MAEVIEKNDSTGIIELANAVDIIAPLQDLLKDIRTKFDDVCSKLNVDEDTYTKAWDFLSRIPPNESSPENERFWFACALYLAGSGRFIRLDVTSRNISGVSLSQVLRVTNVRMVDFFEPLKSFIAILQLGKEYDEELKLVEKNFVVTCILYKKYEKMFDMLFYSDSSIISGHTSSPYLGANYSPSFEYTIKTFGWTLFLVCKAKLLPDPPDLVNAFHLLLCVLNLMVTHTPSHMRKTSFHDAPTPNKNYLRANTYVISNPPISVPSNNTFNSSLVTVIGSNSPISDHSGDDSQSQSQSQSQDQSQSQSQNQSQNSNPSQNSSQGTVSTNTTPVVAVNFNANIAYESDYPMNTLRQLCRMNSAGYEEVKAIEMFMFLPFLENLIANNVLRFQMDKPPTENVFSRSYFYGGLLENPLLLKVNQNEVNKEYEVMNFQVGDLDERLFLENNDQIGTPSRVPPQTQMYYGYKGQSGSASTSVDTNNNNNNENPLSPQSNAGSNNNNNGTNSVISATPVSSTISTVAWLKQTVFNREATPSPILRRFFRACTVDPTQSIEERIRTLIEKVDFPTENKMFDFYTNFNSKSITQDGNNNNGENKGNSKGSKTKTSLENMVVDSDTLRTNSSLEDLNNVRVTNQDSIPENVDSGSLTPPFQASPTLFPSKSDLSGFAINDESKNSDSESQAPISEAHNSLEQLENRKFLGVKFYYKLLENILLSEQARLNQDNFSTLLNNDLFHRSLLAGCLEIIIYTYKMHAYSFPYILRVLEVSPFDFCKLIENIVKHETLPKVLVGHLGRIEEKILESLAWEQNSPIWEILKINTPKKSDKVMFKSPSNVTPKSQTKGSSHSLDLFLRKIMVIARLRAQNLCANLNLPSIIYQQLCRSLVYIIDSQTELMMGRHLDQIIMCTLYGVCRVNQMQVTFRCIIDKYSLQIQASSKIYRDVLLQSEDKRGDIISFYNNIYIPIMEPFLLTHSQPASSDVSNSQNNPQLNMPSIISPKRASVTIPQSPQHKISSNYNIYVSPITSRVPPSSRLNSQTPRTPQFYHNTNPHFISSTPRSALYNFGQSPAHELRQINEYLNAVRDQTPRILNSLNNINNNNNLLFSPPSNTSPSTHSTPASGRRAKRTLFQGDSNSTVQQDGESSLSQEGSANKSKRKTKE